MIRTHRGLLLLGIVTLLVGLIVTFPARVAYHWLTLPGVALSGLEGTVWRGTAEAANVRGVYLQDVSWRFRPLRLFTAKAAYRVDATPRSGFIETDVMVGFGGVVRLGDLTASLALPTLAGPLRIRGLQGNASLRFERIDLQRTGPVAADGALEVNSLVVPRISPQPIGGYRAEFFSQENGIGASVEDTDGVIDIAGSLQFNRDGSYEFIAQLVATPETPEGLRRQLQFLPPADERGRQELRIEGSL